MDGIDIRIRHAASVIWSDIVRCDLLKQASAMAYITLFSLVPSLAFKASDLWSPISVDLLIIASRVYRLATGKMSYIVPAMQRTMLQEAARMPSSHYLLLYYNHQ